LFSPGHKRLQTKKTDQKPRSAETSSYLPPLLAVARLPIILFF
jgi:hypothetical protein